MLTPREAKSPCPACRVALADAERSPPACVSASNINPSFGVQSRPLTRLDTPALGHVLETEFRALLGPVPAGKRVAPMTVMNVQDLENLEKSIGHFSLAALLASHTRDCTRLHALAP
jgi:hypothetical protein